MEGTIMHKWNFNHPPELVWEYLTKPELLGQWLMPNDIKPVAGHRFQFRTKPRFRFDGNVYCQVLEVVPLKRLSYSWQGGPAKGKVSLDTVVSWTLTPTDKGTELLLEHKGFKGMKNYLAYFILNRGWAVHIPKRLGELLNKYRHETSSR